MEVRGYKTEVALGKSSNSLLAGGLERRWQRLSGGCLGLLLMLPAVAAAAVYVPNAGQAMRDIQATQPALSLIHI